MADKFTVQLNVKNIGPHSGDNEINFHREVKSNKAIFFAANGTGKSFISRAFRLTSADKQNGSVDDLLTLEQATGALNFTIKSARLEKTLSVSVARGSSPVVNNNTGIIFHVFNSDFVEENIKPRHYSPDGNIEGYILGKTQIDLSTELEREIGLKEELKKKKKDIDTTIQQAKKEVREQGVMTTTTEFSLLEEGKLRGDKHIDSDRPFQEVVAQLEALAKVPEKLNDISKPSLSVDYSVFDSVITLLSTPYPNTEWDEDFVATIKKNRAFIETGLNLIGEEGICPFCKQSFGVDALALIRKYNEYLTDKEAEILRSIESSIKAINEIVDRLKKNTQATKNANADIVSLRQYFPSLDDTKLEIPNTDEDALRNFTSIVSWLEAKLDNLAITVFTIDGDVAQCRAFIKTIADDTKRNAAVIDKVNKTKQDINGERLSLRRNLCKSQYVLYKAKLEPFFADYDKTQTELGSLQASIVEMEQQAKISKRDKVYETLTFLLNLFFAGKYTIDKDTFHINFRGNRVGDKASSILSDGEKGIVAYCYFLASTHLLINREDDYNKLFFIIDDPVSSMDFHYVYVVAQLLRDLKALFGIRSYERIWVFTHNREFLSIIVRNRIISQAFVLKPGSIKPLKHQLLMPYESHLVDILEIAKGRLPPSHTTANSIRHVLETVSRFEYPEKNLYNYVDENEILSKDSYIYTLAQDLSHGGLRNELSYLPEVLVAACRTVETFMRSRYEGQVCCLANVHNS